ncbi:hypothetical protein RJ640_005689 [Escallonia rubra]|uniref:AAA+ ATPase domain-containing protein n=1 Tax=Escallonia rubra TaxID=112253 RepID=A0AA88RVC6_9ASTE|nr:hypothetical protein RJ640_005689 [Escallonia rubra]
MASMRRLARTIQSCRSSIAARQTLAPPHRLHFQSSKNQIYTYASEGRRPRSLPEIPGLFSVPAILAGLLGVGLLDIAHADSEEAHAKTPIPTESPTSNVDSKANANAKPPVPTPTPSSYVDLEESARNEKRLLEELLKSKNMKYGSYPQFTVAVKGQKITVKFQIPPTCEIPLLVANLVERLGVKLEERGGGSDMTLRAWDSGVAWQLTLGHPDAHDGDLCILMFRSLISQDKAEIEFIKRGGFSTKERDALVSVLQLAGPNRTLDRRPRGDVARTTEKSVASLEAMGVKVYGLNMPKTEFYKEEMSWDNIAGYGQQKREIEDTILLALRSPEVYDDIAHGTRCKFETSRPRAVLFDGPPGSLLLISLVCLEPEADILTHNAFRISGTGKTSCARVISNQAGIPLLYVPLEVLMSKYYGESEGLLGKVFSLANQISSDGAIIFLDEVDSLATARDSETHEATRRILSVLLQQIDGFEQDKKVVVIAATNRKQDLDPAFISRFDSMITFGLPDQQTREEIAAQYAKHLTKPELAELAIVTEDMSGRDIRDVCRQAERRWASKVIRGQAPKDNGRPSLPPIEEYIESANFRRRSLPVAAAQSQNSNPPAKNYDSNLI